MWIYYLLALIPVTIGLVLLVISNNRDMAIKQWLIGSVSAFIVAGIIHGLTIYGMTTDTEILTGQIESATYYPHWVNTYEEAHHTFDSDGNISMTWYTTEHDNKDNYSEMNVSFGRNVTETMRIDNNYFEQLSRKFNNRSYSTPFKSGFYSGDRNVYHTFNKNGFCIPITIEKSFKNRVKASPSSFSFDKVPSNIPVFDYPYSKNAYKSNRLVGDAANKLDIGLFDQLNSRVGRLKKGNVIVVGFNSPDSKLGDYQRNKWLSGKKNDIVICYGVGTLEYGVTNVVWTKAFSWGDENKKLLGNLEKMFKEEPINNSILLRMEKEIFSNFKKMEWSKLDYIKISPSPMWYWIYGIVMLISQVVIWFCIANLDDGRY